MPQGKVIDNEDEDAYGMSACERMCQIEMGVCVQIT